jgi:hypothetical protein
MVTAYVVNNFDGVVKIDPLAKSDESTSNPDRDWAFLLTQSDNNKTNEAALLSDSDEYDSHIHLALIDIFPNGLFQHSEDGISLLDVSDESLS